LSDTIVFIYKLQLGQERHFIYFPLYSPDLSPIEFGWKDLKRELSSILDFDEMIKSCEGVTSYYFGERKRVIQDTGW